MTAKKVEKSWFMATAATRATLRAVGAGTVTLKMCGGVVASPGNDGLGLKVPAMESVELFPVLLRIGSDGAREVLVDAGTLESAAGVYGDGIEEVLTKSARLEVCGAEKKITSVASDHLGGAAYLYRLTVEA